MFVRNCGKVQIKPHKNKHIGMCKIKRLWSHGKIYVASSNKEIHELPDLTMPFDHSMQVCQGTCKFRIKDEEWRISVTIFCCLKAVVKP